MHAYFAEHVAAQCRCSCNQRLVAKRPEFAAALVLVRIFSSLLQLLFFQLDVVVAVAAVPPKTMVTIDVPPTAKTKPQLLPAGEHMRSCPTAKSHEATKLIR